MPETYDRVRETTTTTGTGSITLAGAVAGFRTFASVLSVADTCWYCIEAIDDDGVPTGDWEVGVGTLSDSTTLARTSILASSNSGSAVSLAAGTKNIFITFPGSPILDLTDAGDSILHYHDADRARANHTGTQLAATISDFSSAVVTAGTGTWQPLDSDLTIWAGLTPSANAQSLVTAANYAAMRALLDLEAGTDFYSIAAADAAFQPKDATLTAFAALTIAANSLTIGTGADAFSQTAFAANTFPARASTGDLVAKAITDGILAFLATPSSANLATAVTDETGSGALVFATSPGFTTAANPVSNDGAALGTTALGWSDLHLATGSVINWANGNVTLTHSATTLTLSATTTFVLTEIDILNGTADFTGTTIDMENVALTASGTATINLGDAASLEIPNGAAPTVNTDGEIALDTTVADFSHGLLRVYGGEEQFVISLPVAALASPTNAHVIAYNSTNDEFELVAQTDSTPTAITVANEATDTSCFPLFVTAATGDLGPKTVASFTLNSNTGALGITTIELGHASDTTLSRLAAGLLGVEGVPVASLIAVVNGSGATAAANEIGYINTSGQYATTTTANLDAPWCVVVVGGANGATIYVQNRGLATILCTAANSAGDWLVTSTTAGQAATNGTNPHYAMFAKVISASGGAGQTCTALLYCHTKFVEATSTNSIFVNTAHGDTAFTCAINGSPSATSVVYDTIVGNEDILACAATTELGKQVLWNSTRSTGRLVTANNTGTNTITTVSTSDAWADNDALTVVSQTITGGNLTAGVENIDIDLSQTTEIPVTARGLMMVYGFSDTATNKLSGLMPYEAYAASKVFSMRSVVVSVADFRIVQTPLVSRRFGWACDANGAGTAITIFNLRGYWEAVP